MAGAMVLPIGSGVTGPGFPRWLVTQVKIGRLTFPRWRRRGLAHRQDRLRLLCPEGGWRPWPGNSSAGAGRETSRFGGHAVVGSDHDVDADPVARSHEVPI
ncbi:MAG: hypothetical protein AVDCRST_MAG87-56, partial [uncultured Thermomicrobiales bacterium]